LRALIKKVIHWGAIHASLCMPSLGLMGYMDYVHGVWS
jgi:hypothetical protein